MQHSWHQLRLHFLGRSGKISCLIFAMNDQQLVEPSSSPSALMEAVGLSLLGEVSQIDAMAADWVANRLLLVGKRELTTIHLDQLQDSPSTVLLKKLFPLSLGAQDAKQLVYDPFTNTAYLLTKNGSLFALDLNRGIESNLELTTGCLRQKTIPSIVGEFVWNKAASPQLYALTWNGLTELKLNSDNNCPDINVNWSMFGGLTTFNLERPDPAEHLKNKLDSKQFTVFATPNDLLVYDRQTAAVSQFPSPSPPIRQLLAVSQSSQPFPNRDCFQLPPASQISFNVKNEGRTGAVVEVHELQLQKDAQQQQSNECVNVSQPITQYDVHFRKRGTDKHQQEKIKTVHSSSNRIVVDNGVLEKYTDFCYGVTVSWLNHYCPPQGQSEAKLLHTGFGYPSAPKEPKALALTPDTVLLSWTLPDLLSAPITEIRYRVNQLSPALANPVPVAVRPAEGTAGHFSAALAAVRHASTRKCDEGKQKYHGSLAFWVLVFGQEGGIVCFAIILVTRTNLLVCLRRPYRNRPSRVSLRELIAMIVGVGRGCVYLEKYKHVHRDLAARNCCLCIVIMRASNWSDDRWILIFGLIQHICMFH
ncbi:protein tyrosine kinase activity protein [Globodera pallida]|nr:protein tyrosine kinase activity protein [Globodera pallida]